MKNVNNTPEHNAAADDMNNIISINRNDIEQEEFDYDFDYDPNEMYYFLNGTNN